MITKSIKHFLLFSVFFVLSNSSVFAQRYFKGDVNGDSTLTTIDIDKTIEIIENKITPNDNEKFAADFNSDGNINTIDVVGILGLLNKKPKPGIVKIPTGVYVDINAVTILSGTDEVIPNFKGEFSIEERSVYPVRTFWTFSFKN